MSRDFKSIGQRIYQMRVTRGWTQTYLSEGICTPSMISQVESGKALLSQEKLQALAMRLGVSYLDLIQGQEHLIEARVQLEILHNYVQQHLYDQALELSGRLLHEFREEFTFDQMVSLRFNRADALMRTEQYQEAIDLLLEAEKELREHDHPRDMAVLYNKIGNVYTYSSDLLKALMYYGQANQYSVKYPNDFTTAQIAYNLGTTLYWLNRHDEAMDYFQKAHAIYDSVHQGQLADTLYMMGLCYNNDNDLERAEECLRQARTIYETQNMLRLSQKAREAYAFLVLSKKNPTDAKRELLDCSTDYLRMDEKSQVAFTYARLASLALDEGQIEEARRYLGLSDTYGFGRSLLRDQRAAFTYRVKARVGLADKEYETCIKYAKNSFVIFDNIGYVKEASKSLQLAGKAYELLGDLEEALRVSNQVVGMLQAETVSKGV